MGRQKRLFSAKSSDFPCRFVVSQLLPSIILAIFHPEVTRTRSYCERGNSIILSSPWPSYDLSDDHAHLNFPFPRYATTASYQRRRKLPSVSSLVDTEANALSDYHYKRCKVRAKCKSYASSGQSSAGNFARAVDLSDGAQ